MDDVHKNVSGEGKLVLAMLCSFIEASGTHRVYGILFSPVQVS